MAFPNTIWPPLAFPNTMWIPAAFECGLTPTPYTCSGPPAPSERYPRILRHIRAARAIRYSLSGFMHIYMHICGVCRVQQESIQSKLLVETAQLSQCSLPRSGSAGGHPFHYSVGITAYLQCLHSPTFGQHGGKWHPSRTEWPMGTATPHNSHAEWLFLM